MPTTPNWEAAENGLPNNLNATNHATQANQELGTHSIAVQSEGIQIVTPSGGTQFLFDSAGNNQDWAQPFTQPIGFTSIGRVLIPMRSFGTGGDFLVSLCSDNGSGAPDQTNVLAAVSVSAQMINNLGAKNGLSTGGPLAIPDFNTMYGTGSIQTVNWAAPAADQNGTASFASATVSGNYIIFLGGSTTVPVGNVTTAQYLGGNTLDLPVPQPPLPKPAFYGAATTTSTSVVFTGGTDGTSVFNNVWTASWDSNTGVIGNWSAQAVLPVPVKNHCMASSNDTVYAIAGATTGDVLVDNVYYAKVSNGQISSWTKTYSLPVPMYRSAVGVIGSRLYAVGGAINNAPDTATTAVYYADIHSDGSLGPWQSTMPPLPTGVYQYAPGTGMAVTDSALITVGGFTAVGSTTNAIQVMTVNDQGFSHRWYETIWAESGVENVFAFNTGDSGRWEIINPIVTSSIYRSTTMRPVSMISVPIQVSGLTAGNKYHIVLQQHQYSDASDFVQFGVLDDNPLPNPALVSVRHSGVWTTNPIGSTWGIPIVVFNRSQRGNSTLHTSEDFTNTGNTYNSNLVSRWSTYVYNDYNGLLLGTAAATVLPNDPLNVNPTFTSGVSPWTATGCTFTQSSAQVHGGFPFSGLMTPDGVTANPHVQSESVPILPNSAVLGNVNYYFVSGWVYSTSGTSFSLNFKWFDLNNVNFTTSSNFVSVPAATWTFLSNYYLAPSTAAYGAIVPIYSGTPLASNTTYLSNVSVVDSIERTSTLSDIAAITYGGNGWPPLEVTQLS